MDFVNPDFSSLLQSLKKFSGKQSAAGASWPLGKSSHHVTSISDGDLGSASLIHLQAAWKSPCDRATTKLTPKEF